MERKIMLIALDYDGTYTTDPELWDQFIANARMRGHEVYCVTMRYAETENEEVETNLGAKVDKIIYTNRKAKKAAFRIQCNKNPDIWIDDNPDWLYEDAL